MFKTKEIPIPLPRSTEPSLEDRLLEAQLLSKDARSQFLAAALDLESTANELDILAADTQKELDRLTDILTAAIEDSDASRRVAKNLRNLVEAESDLTLF